MRNLTPYDTGERLEPRLYVSAGQVRMGVPDIDPDRYGRVDLDDDEGTTRATLWTEPDGLGGHVLHVQLWTDAVEVQVHE